MPSAEVCRIAFIDDDPAFQEALTGNLEDAGMSVTCLPSGEEAMAWFRDGGTADVVLLDWRMPGMDGIDVLNAMRAEGFDDPVIFLTVLNDQIYEEAALAGGAIDFVEKSRNFPILLRRIHLIVGGRKFPATAEADTGREPGDDATIRVGDLELFSDHCRAMWKNVEVDLTLTEYKIVALLAGNPGTDTTYREIYDQVRGEGFVAGYGDVGYRTNVRAFIKRIRQKFKAIDESFEAIENYPGFGYRWQN
ncbi:response regulator transcription factor [Fodinicurvata sp. EGI_FJ10296]|uniref:response regulator transcription factor n=1 Tax=Fodinicurvata sp. EGI_FJ10296 TaxID=3231908 RepID=UPI003453ABBC